MGSIPQRDTGLDMDQDLERMSHLALSREGSPVGERMSVIVITAILALLTLGALIHLSLDLDPLSSPLNSCTLLPAHTVHQTSYPIRAHTVSLPGAGREAPVVRLRALLSLCDIVSLCVLLMQLQ